MSKCTMTVEQIDREIERFRAAAAQLRDLRKTAVRVERTLRLEKAKFHRGDIISFFNEMSKTICLMLVTDVICKGQGDAAYAGLYIKAGRLSRIRGNTGTALYVSDLKRVGSARCLHYQP